MTDFVQIDTSKTNIYVRELKWNEWVEKYFDYLPMLCDKNVLLACIHFAYRFFHDLTSMSCYDGQFINDHIVHVISH